ncbi:AfsR/SARP family transcriptional regulator [Pseudonocardiaceae bacterium YIM PH 21723]|nr:AfsR/SARP family transcriptional regulator [Pseudonocardiaceae bacterium YIM PH 21723]
MDGGPRLRVTLLGGVAAFRGDTPLPVPGARLQALLVRLALAGGRPVDPGALIDAIWAENPPSGAAHALQALVSRLRRALDPVGDIAQLAGGYRLAVDPADVDAVRFEHLAAAGRDRLRADDPAGAAALLGEAVALWGEPTALPSAVATRLTTISVEAAADLAAAELALGQTDAATTRLTALLADHHVHERAAALLMDALAAQGRQAEALARYEQVREALADSLGADPGAALRERHLRLLQDDRPAPQARPSNLPAPLTSFIGRDADLTRLGALLAAGRLVTVLGPGGAGKTRLAVEAAHRHPDSSWLIDLASVTEPTEVGTAVLAAIGLRGAALFEASAELRGDPAGELDVLAERLDGREILLVVDNCEHLIDAVAHLMSALLARCRGLRVLATSREPLAIDGEVLVPLGPLPLPEPDATVEQARDTASVQLFTERAAAVRPGFGVDEHTLTEILRIVRGLDGIPLALELAAARLRTLSLTDLADGLSDRFRLLTTGSRTAAPRHRTLRAVIAWSWDLLGADARTVAERIAVLPGGVTAGSAGAVCPEIPAIAELLADLVDRSLLRLVPDTGRYRMLETIREYGLERLAEQGILTGVRDRAAAHFADLVTRNDPLLRGPQQLDAIHVLRAEYDNVLAALRHLCDTGAADEAIGIALNLSWYWQVLGLHRDAAHWLGAAVALPAGQPGLRRDMAEAMLLMNTIATQGALVSAEMRRRRVELRSLTERLMEHPGAPDFHGTPAAIVLVSLAESGSSPAITQLLVDGTDVWIAGLAQLFRAQFNENEGQLDPVREDVGAALDCFTRAGDRWGMAKALPLRALLRQYDGDLDGARDDLVRAKQLAREFGSLILSDEIFIDLRLIDLHVRLGERRQAAEMITAIRKRAVHSTSPVVTSLFDAREAAVCLLTGELDRARELIESAEAEAAGHLFNGGQALIGAVRGALCLELGDGPGAAEALGRACAAAVTAGDMPIAATVAVPVAGLAALRGRHRDAAVLLGAAARLRGAHDHTDPQVRALSDRGRAALGDEPFAEAYEFGWYLDVPAALARVDPAQVS